ncbi:thiol-disulfide oxidoreductase ResA [Bacillus marinisedimentorum]|uniref:thiol-disulfide oxidoreductase ResA n=1 Tax=Bacillus marinisedimentorum TaxID=1821260 RepID=UPI0007E1E69B|nr:thiol-disulfide oxidoreductase ResA [Bacillus marinisedimentorum]
MQKKKKRQLFRVAILVILFGALAFTLYTNFFNSKDVVGVGDQAPNFVLEDMEGNKIEMEELRGKGVFLNFWGTWCEPCKEEMPYMQSQYEIYKDRGVEIVAVNVSETKLAVNRFANTYGLTFPIVIDKGEVLDAYGVNPLPTTFLIDKDGKIVDKITAGMTEQMVADYMKKIEP